MLLKIFVTFNYFDNISIYEVSIIEAKTRRHLFPIVGPEPEILRLKNANRKISSTYVGLLESLTSHLRKGNPTLPFFIGFYSFYD